MISVPNKKILNKLKNKEENELALVVEEKKVYKYFNGAWTPLEANSIGVNLYDINKMIINQLPPMPEAQMREIIEQYFNNNNNNNHYYMIYSKEINYFTVLHLIEEGDKIDDVIIECLNNIGDIHSISYIKDENVIECWISANGENVVAYIFPYDGGIVECHK